MQYKCSMICVAALLDSGAVQSAAYMSHTNRTHCTRPPGGHLCIFAFMLLGGISSIYGYLYVCNSWTALCHAGNPKEDVVAAIHDHLREVRQQLEAGQVPLGKFVITKQLTKRPEDYPDAKVQPHVQVALRRRATGKRDGVMPGETVPYVICVRLDANAGDDAHMTDAAAAAAAGGEVPGSTEQITPGGSAVAGTSNVEGGSPGVAGTSGLGEANGLSSIKQEAIDVAGSMPSSTAAPGANIKVEPAGGNAVGVVKHEKGKGRGGKSSGGHMAERAYHPEELREDASLAVDKDYYLGQQVHPVVARLCGPIEVSPATLALIDNS